MADNRHHRHCFSDGSTDVSIELERQPATIDGNVVVSSSAEGTTEITGIKVVYIWSYYGFSVLDATGSSGLQFIIY